MSNKDYIYRVRNKESESFYDMNMESMYNDFINSIIGFLSDIKTLSIYKSISKENRFLHFGVILVLISISLIPLWN